MRGSSEKRCGKTEMQLDFSKPQKNQKPPFGGMPHYQHFMLGCQQNRTRNGAEHPAR
jgi:hypothetical protein